MNVVRQLVGRQPGVIWLILGFACLGEVIWFAWVNVGFDGDSVQYLRYANTLAGIKMPYMSDPATGAAMDFASISRRTAGYPLLLWLGGVPITGSLIGIMLIQAIMAIAMPVLIYKMLAPFGSRMALVVALVLIVSLEPFNASKTLLTEQSFKFLIILLLYLAVRAYRTPSQCLFAATASVAVFLALVRPQAGFVAVLVFGMLLIAHPRRWMSLGTYFVSVVAVLGVFSFSTALYLAAHVPPEFPEKLQEKPGTFQARLENLLLYHLHNSRLYGTPALAAAGPERDKLRLILQSYAEQYPEEWTKLAPRHYFGAFAGAPSRWVDEIYRNPNPYYFNMIKVAVAAFKNSPDQTLKGMADELLPRVIMETYSATPRHLLSFIARYFLGSATTSGAPIAWSQFYTAGLAPFSAQNGPASREIVDLTKTCFSECSGFLPADPHHYPGGIDQLMKEGAFPGAAEGNFWWYWSAVDHLKGPMESGRIFLGSLGEFGYFHYLKIVLSIDKLAEFFFGMPSSYQTGARKYDNGNFFLIADQSALSSDLPANMLAEIQSGIKPARFVGPDVGGPDFNRDVHWYTAVWLALRDVTNLAIIATLLFCFRAGNGWPAMLIGLVILYNAAVVALVTDTYIRYIDVMMPLSLALAGLSVGSFVSGERPLSDPRGAVVIKS